MKPLTITAAAVLLGVALTGCSTPRVSTGGGIVAPNPNLVVQGIPPIPARIAAQVAGYTDFAGHAFVDWHPLRREMLVAHRPPASSVQQLFRVTGPLAEPERLTDGADPVRRASYEPSEGRYIVFERAAGGNEQDKLYRLDLPGRQITPLTETPERHSIAGWLHRSARMLVISTPLDRTAPGGSRAQITQTLSLLDPLRPEATEKLVELPGGGWLAGGVSWDDRQVALTRYVSANESEVWILDLSSRALARLLPGPGDAVKASWFAGEFTRDNRALYVRGDAGGEFRELQRFELAGRTLSPITRDIPWDVSGDTLDRTGALIAVQANVDGRNELRLYDSRSLKPVAVPALPPGSVDVAEFHRLLPDLAVSVDSAKGPSQIWSIDVNGGRIEQWTRAATPRGTDTSSFPEQQIVRWPSFDGRTVSGLLTLPPSRFPGRRPVLVAIHGGPEAQASFGFLGRSNYHVNELGIALIQPNVRGSSGFGKTFLALDNGVRREDSVKDIGALLDWIATQPGLDASRVVVSGGSYGGYMSLAVATLYPDRIAGAIDIVGISNFLTFLQNTESYRRDLRRVEYGDERDPAMRAHLEKISPMTNAGKIRKPLFVVQGKNDPRVPVTESEQMVERVRANGSPVWYLRAENEGHGFARRENVDFQFYATVLFLQRTLGLD